MITIVDYNAGNLRSVKRACDAIGFESVLTHDPDAVALADRIIFPGVGNAGSAMKMLERTGLAGAVRHAFERGVPILGICLGAQIVLTRSEEGDVPGLDLLEGRTRRFALDDRTLKIPHMGWNEVRVVKPHPVLRGIEPGDEFYFVHSYYPDPVKTEYVYAVTEYGKPFCCALGRGSLFASQFHPEKSGRLGLDMLRRFAAWDGSAC